MAFSFHKIRDHHGYDEELEAIYKQRRERFRILVCLNGTEESTEGLKIAADIAQCESCDIILLYVRPIDQGLRSGGLQVHVARENMLDWGLELPGITFLKQGLNMLVNEEDLEKNWKVVTSHTDTWGDPLGDNKVEYRHKSGKSIVLKLKTAPDPASGILDQYELGPYNLMIMGSPSRWRGEIKSFFDTGAVQKVAMRARCSVMVARARPKGTDTTDDEDGKGYMICIDGTKRSLDSMRRVAVLAQFCAEPITLFAVARTEDEKAKAEKLLKIGKGILAKANIPIAGAHYRVGNPAEQILAFGNDYTVIAVADSGKSWLYRLLFESVAFDVMSTAKTSVLNIR